MGNDIFRSLVIGRAMGAMGAPSRGVGEGKIGPAVHFAIFMVGGQAQEREGRERERE